MKPRALKRVQAAERQAKRAARTATEQLALLKKRPGSSAKESRRLRKAGAVDNG